MKLECVKDKMRDAVSAVERITGKNLTLPVLSSILVVADGTSLKLRATNLDIGVEVEIPAKIEKPGIVAIPGSIVNNFLSSLSGDAAVRLEQVGENLLLSTKRTSTTIHTLPYDDFPTLPSVSDGASFKISLKNFIQGLKSVSYSAATSDIKPELASVYLHVDHGHLVFAATDGFRLAEKRIQVSLKEDFAPLLIPLKNVIEMIRLFDGKTGDVEISYSKNQLSLVFENIYFTSRLIDGVFPDYKQIMPKAHTTEAIVLKQDLGAALKVATIFSDKFNQLTFIAEPTKKHFEVYSKNVDVGENTTTLDATVSGEPITLSFSHRALADVFQSIDKDSLTLEFNGEGKPLVVKPVGDASFTYLVMPINR